MKTMDVWFYSLAGVLIVSLISFVGLFFLVIQKEKLKKLLLFLVSFATGGLLGDTFIHLLPEAIEKKGFTPEVSLTILAGILLFFVLEKFICWRHCHIPPSKQHPHPLVFMNLIGDGLHNFIDGAIIAGSFSSSFSLGVTTLVAVVLHEIPQEIGDFGVLLHGGFSRNKALFFNFISALGALLGAVLPLGLDTKGFGFSSLLVPFTAGGFIYIAGSDLIPELQKESSLAKSLAQMIGLSLGIGLMFWLLLV